MSEKDKKCRCTKKCDCENPPPEDWDGKDGVWHISNECPVHNWDPHPNPDCPVHGKVREYF
jgi:hypothetical protein